MNRAGKPNSMLIELVIVLLFFSLSAAVILQLFFAAHSANVRASVGSAALLTVEDTAERFTASDLPADAFFAADEGWTFSDGVYARQMTEQKRPLRLVAEVAVEQTGAGALDNVMLTMYDGDTQLVSLPVGRYTPGEGAP